MEWLVFSVLVFRVFLQVVVRTATYLGKPVIPVSWSEPTPRSRGLFRRPTPRSRPLGDAERVARGLMGRDEILDLLRSQTEIVRNRGTEPQNEKVDWKKEGF